MRELVGLWRLVSSLAASGTAHCIHLLYAAFSWSRASHGKLQQLSDHNGRTCLTHSPLELPTPLVPQVASCLVAASIAQSGFAGSTHAAVVGTADP